MTGILQNMVFKYLWSLKAVYFIKFELPLNILQIVRATVGIYE